ncbi:SGNH/GDSL hydrolase family protein [Bradyrhizobium sp. Leo170]|uniref:SGNH/GDSL hydrolase family protein n=1 Tax=Bradyrhizobium sp. Leo170 TaxID=1571199 RepID=UPI0013EEB679|nr:SGNH/GDSL hydrolase family protein [Bradyrhizobium sp. Leo170]
MMKVPRTRRELLTPKGRARLGGVNGGGGGVRLPFGTPISFPGDSIIANGFSLTTNRAWETVRGWHVWANALANSPFRLMGKSNAGVGGNTSAQLLARYDTDVIAFNPGAAHIHIGINDLLAATASATTLANITAMIAKNRAIGAFTFVNKMLPYGSTALPMNGPQIALWEATNNGIAAMAADDVVVLDFEPVIGNMDAAHTMKDGYSGDSPQLHPNQTAAYLMAKVVRDAYLAHSIPGENLFTTNNDPANFAANGFLTGTTGTVSGATGQVATGWTGAGAAAGGATVAYSKVARSDGFGEWQQIAVSGTYTGTGKIARISRAIPVTGLLSTGDVVQIGCEIQVDATQTAVSSFRAGFTQGADSVYAFAGNNTDPVQEAWSGVIMSVPFAITATPTTVSVELGILLKDTATTDACAASVRFGRYQIEKLASLN